MKDTGANTERWDGASDWSLKKELQRNQQGMDESEEESEEQIKKKEHYLPQCSVKSNLHVSLSLLAVDQGYVFCLLYLHLSEKPK